MIEVVAPESVARDWRDKYLDYERAGVREYWILDLDERRATFLTLRDGHFEEMPLKDSVFSSAVLSGFGFDVNWLWSKERPLAYQVVQQLPQGR